MKAYESGGYPSRIDAFHDDSQREYHSARCDCCARLSYRIQHQHRYHCRPRSKHRAADTDVNIAQAVDVAARATTDRDGTINMGGVGRGEALAGLPWIKFLTRSGKQLVVRLDGA